MVKGQAQGSLARHTDMLEYGSTGQSPFRSERAREKVPRPRRVLPESALRMRSDGVELYAREVS